MTRSVKRTKTTSRILRPGVAGLEHWSNGSYPRRGRYLKMRFQDGNPPQRWVIKQSRKARIHDLVILTKGIDWRLCRRKRTKKLTVSMANSMDSPSSPTGHFKKCFRAYRKKQTGKVHLVCLLIKKTCFGENTILPCCIVSLWGKTSQPRNAVFDFQNTMQYWHSRLRQHHHLTNKGENK